MYVSINLTNYSWRGRRGFRGEFVQVISAADPRGIDTVLGVRPLAASGSAYPFAAEPAWPRDFRLQRLR